MGPGRPAWPRYSRLSRCTRSMTVRRSVGLLALSRSSDVVDGHLVQLALRLRDDILTGDPDDLSKLVSVLGPAGPRVHRWP